MSKLNRIEQPEDDRQAFDVTETETRIFKLCQRAVLERWSKEVFKAKVDKEIKNLVGELKSETLKKKCVDSLHKYAQKTFAKQMELLRQNAFWLSAIAVALYYGDTKAKKYEAEAKKQFSPEYRATEGFQTAYKAQYREVKRQATTFDEGEPYYRHRVPLDEYHREYMKKVADITEDLVNSNAQEDYTTNVSLRNIAEMTVRYEHQLDMIDTMKESGTKLVWIEPHANCSERCQKYQVGGSLHPSGLYSLDGTTGRTEDGIFFRPLEFATDNPQDLYTTKEGKQYQNGCITGFNCRHKLKPYKRGGSAPKPIPAKVIDKQRAIEKTQRAMERGIRKNKKKYILYKEKDPELAKKIKARIKMQVNRYEAFSRKNEVPFYRERTDLLADDR